MFFWRSFLAVLQSEASLRMESQGPWTDGTTMNSIIFQRDASSAGEMSPPDREEIRGRLWVRQVVSSRHIPGPEEDIRLGLLQTPRTLPPKYFYDERGARLFEEVCTTPEYYPT